jgi:isochorismate hydrolase
MNNYRVSIVEDACFDRSEVSHAISLFDMSIKYADVVASGAVLSFIESYPDNQFDLPSGKGMKPAAE